MISWFNNVMSGDRKSGGDADKRLSSERDDPISYSFECYACNQVGVPIFHSTSCDQSHEPQWEAFAGSSLFPIHGGATRARSLRHRPPGPLGSVLDPRSALVKKWNRALLVARGVSLAVDPLFLYSLTLATASDGGAPCLHLDGGLAAVATVVRTLMDVAHLWHIWIQFRLAYVSKESLVVGCGKLVWDARAIASRYLRSLKGFWFDIFVILPVPQAMFWAMVPRLLREERIRLLLLIFLIQFIPKVYHCLCLMRRMRKVTGYIFGSLRWGFTINLIAYLFASQVTGGCWYLLATRRALTCLLQGCERRSNCDLSSHSKSVICSQSSSYCGGNSETLKKSLCLDVRGPFPYGIYQPAVPLMSSNSRAVRILYPIFWGLLSLSSFGNELAPTSNWVELLFSICIVLGGLTLFTLLIGNIQVFLGVIVANKKKLQLRGRDVEWWMRRRQLPSCLRRRVRHFERQKWDAMGGEEDVQWIEELPEGLRRDIKRYLCIDLIRKVPLFHGLDDLILDNICDRVKPLLYSKDEKILREGDPVQRMVFIVHGQVKRSQRLSRGKVSSSMVEPGGFLGDELLFWCLRRPFMDHLPASSATFTCTQSTEAFSIEANHLRFITDHFRYKFASESLKRTARYFSSNWRTWAAVNIQLAWRRYWTRRIIGPPVPMTAENGVVVGQLRKYAAMFLSLRPHDHLG